MIFRAKKETRIVKTVRVVKSLNILLTIDLFDVFSCIVKRTLRMIRIEALVACITVYSKRIEYRFYTRVN